MRAWGRKFTAARMPPGALQGFHSSKRVGMRWFKIWPKTARHDMNYITTMKFQDTFLVFPSLHPLVLPPISILLSISKYFSPSILLVADNFFISSGVSLPVWGPTVVFFLVPMEKSKNLVFISVCFHFIFVQPLTSSICFYSPGSSPRRHVLPPALSLKTQS